MWEQIYLSNHANTANIEDTHEILCLNILLVCYYYKDFRGHLSKGFLPSSRWLFFSPVGNTDNIEKSLLPWMWSASQYMCCFSTELLGMWIMLVQSKNNGNGKVMYCYVLNAS